MTEVIDKQHTYVIDKRSELNIYIFVLHRLTL